MSSARVILAIAVLTLIGFAALPTSAVATNQESGAEAEQGEIQAEPPLILHDEMDDLLITPEVYFYESLGRRDVFVSLVSARQKEGNRQGKPGSGDLTVVGILWGENDRFALVESADGRSMLLREGSTIGDGTVLQVLPDEVRIHVTAYGTSHTVSLPLVQGGSFNESPRSRNR